METISAQVTEHGATLSTQGSEITDLRLGQQQQMGVLYELGRRIDDFGMTVRAESRSLAVGVGMGFERLVDALVGMSCSCLLYFHGLM